MCEILIDPLWMLAEFTVKRDCDCFGRLMFVGEMTQRSGALMSRWMILAWGMNVNALLSVNDQLLVSGL